LIPSFFASGVPERLAHLSDDRWLRLVIHDLRQPFDPGDEPFVILAKRRTQGGTELAFSLPLEAKRG